MTDLIKKNQLEEAHTIIEFEIAKNPKIPSTWLDYAKLMLAKNDSEKSWAGLMQAQKLIKTTIFSQEALNSYESEFYQTEGAWYFQKKYFDKAAQSFNRALKFQKNNNQAHLGVIFSLLAGNKVQEVKPLVLSMQENLPKNEFITDLH